MLNFLSIGFAETMNMVHRHIQILGEVFNHRRFSEDVDVGWEFDDYERA